MPHDHHLDATNHKDAPKCSPTTCHAAPPRRARMNLSPPPVDASHPLEREEHLCTLSPDHLSAHRRTPPAHTAGAYHLQNPGPLPTPHPHDSPHPSTLTPPKHHTSRPHRTWTPFRVHPLPPPRGHTHPLPRDVPPQRAQGPGRHGTHHIHANSGHRSHPHPPQELNGAPCPTASCITTEHVLDESMRNPRVTSTHTTNHPVPPPAPVHLLHHHRQHTSTQGTTGPTHHTPWTSDPLPVGNRTIGPPHHPLPHHRTAASHPLKPMTAPPPRPRRSPPPRDTSRAGGCGSCSSAHPTCSTPSRKEPRPHRSHHIHRGDTHHRRQPHPRPKNTSAHHPTTPAHHVKPLTTVEKYTRIW